MMALFKKYTLVFRLALLTSLVLLVCQQNRLQAQSISVSNKWPLKTVSSTYSHVYNTVGPIEDERYASNTDLSVSGKKDRQTLGYVKIGFDNNVHGCFGDDYIKYTITVDFTYTELTAYPSTYNVVHVEDKKFIIEYDPDNTTNYKESAIFYFKNAYKIDDIEVTGVTVSDGVSTPVPIYTSQFLDNMYIEATLDAEMYQNFNPSLPPADLQVRYVNFSGSGLSPNPKNYRNSVVFNWQTVGGETDVELEWTYINDYGLTDALTPEDEGNLSFTFINNATRVMIPAGQTEYVIPAMYDRGYVAARIRGIGRDFNNLDKVIRSVWSVKCNPNDVLVLDDAPHCNITEDDNSQANWLSSATFVEEGKNKFVVNYGDGSGRVRQQVTLSSTDAMAIATETFYDNQGRAAVQSMPSPVFVKYNAEPNDVYANGIRYFPKLNRNSAGEKYSRDDFDKDPLSGCVVAAAPFTDGIDNMYESAIYSGAGRYYSTLNPKKYGIQAFVPQSAGYPFTISQFTDDNTGRVRKQSGVGPVHTIDGSHATQYFYTTADQVELDRIFGTDAGYGNYYQKTVVVDANGQASVSYSDMNGKTVATALVGNAPSNVQELASPLPAPVTEDIIKSTDSEPLGMSTMVSPDGMSLTVTNNIVVTLAQPYTFNYAVEAANFTNECITEKCLSCKYVLTITLKDGCGNTYVNVNEVVGGEGELGTSCEGLTDYESGDIITDELPIGEYTLTKTLTIDDAALWSNVDLYMQNSTCLLDLEALTPLVDISGCGLTCDACSTRVNAMGATEDDYITSLGSLSLTNEATYRDYYRSVKQECDMICAMPAIDNCGALLQNMLADMSPGGQYAMYKQDPDVPGAYIHDEEVSILSSDANNFLPDWAGTTATWKHPLYYRVSDHTLTAENEYKDENGNTAKVPLTFINGVASPAVEGNSSLYIFTDVDGSKYTKPQYLADVSDFIRLFNTSYAQSLIVYHPEFLGYKWCADRVYDEVVVDFVDNDRTFNSNQFDYFVRNCNLFQARAAFGNDLDILSRDPVLTADPTFLTRLITEVARVYKLDGTNYNIFEAAIINTELAGRYDINTPALINGYLGCTSCTGSIIDNEDEWDNVANFYLSAKAQATLLNTFISALTVNTCWWCIGNENPLPGSGICAMATNQYYQDKEPRIFNFFNNANQALGFDEDVDLQGEGSYDNVTALVDYKYWETTGNCPMARDIELMINQLISKGKLLTTVAEPLTPGPYLTLPLYNLLGGPTVQNYLPTIGSGNLELEWTPASSAGVPSCSTPLTLTIPTGLPTYVTLDNIGQVYGIHDVNWNGTYTTFKLNALFYDDNDMPAYYEIDGKICINLDDCFGDGGIASYQQCLPTPQAKNMLQLMNALSFDGLLDNDINLVSPYTNLIGPELSAMLGAGTKHWNFDGVSTFTLQSSYPGLPTITLNITNFDGLVVSNPAFFKRMYAVTGGTNNQFKIDFIQPFSPVTDAGLLYNYNAAAPIATITGNITYGNSSTSSPFAAISCRQPSPAACNNPENLNFEKLKDLLDLCVQVSYINFSIENVDCLDGLESTGGALTSFTDVLSVDNVELDYTQSTDGLNTHYFKATVTTASGTDYITGRYCKPMRSCVPACPPCPATETATLTFNFTEDDLDNLRTGYVMLPEFNAGCINITLPGTFYYDDVLMDDDDFLDGFTAMLDASSSISAVRTGLSVEVTIPTSALAPGCNCCSSSPVRVITEYTTGLVVISTATINCYDYSVSDDCHELPKPFEQPAPYENSCADDMNSLANATATMLYEDYINTERNKIYQTLKAHCLNTVAETFTKQYSIKEYHYTLYYYDQAGNLYRTVPPLAVRPIADTDSLNAMAAKRQSGDAYVPAHASPAAPAYALITQYRFNSLNQPVEQQTPDGGLSRFWYDALGRLIYSQNAKQAAMYADNTNHYSYTKFDALGRITEVGQLASKIKGLGVPNSPLTQAIAGSASALLAWEATAGYDIAREQITRTYYDENTLPGFDPTFNLRNRVAYSLYFDDPDENFNSGTFYTYDILGNVKQLWQYNGDMPEAHRLKTMHYYYDLASGKVNAVAYQPEGKDRFFHKYKYDADNRLTAVRTWEGADWESIGFTDRNWTADVLPLSNLEHIFPFDEDARYFYYHHGPLARTEVGQLNIQGTDYTYTLQGWIKSVNGTNLSDTLDPGNDSYAAVGNPNRYMAQDAFSYGLDYFDGDYSAINTTNDVFRAAKYTSGAGFGNDLSYLYNGNIAAMTTTLKRPNNNVNIYAQGMQYKYDQLNRITEATAYKNFNRVNNEWNAEAADDDYYNAFTYDANGNILKQLRKAETATNINLDSLQYFYYTGTNQLAYVNDNVSGSNYADDIDDQDPNNYTYDAIGNMISDEQGGITNIEWSVYGKIRFIDKGSNDLSFNYAPDGNRITKLTGERNTYYVRDASGNIMATYTEVSDCFTLDEHPIYGSSRLGLRKKEVCLDEEPTREEGTEDIVYVERGYRNYEFSNHLGNVLTVATDRRTTICDNEDEFVNYEADVISVTDYYPFGSPMAGRTHNQDGYRFGFNGKENDNETYGTGNALDFGARIYDPRIGRWLSTDPLQAEFPDISPHAFCFDNPTKFIDPTGEAPEDIIVTGANNSSITIVTDLIDIKIDASYLGIGFGGEYKLDGKDVTLAALDIAGIVDPTGAADLTAGVMYASDGEWVDALISFAGTLPYVGDLAKSKRIVKSVDIITNAVKNAKKVEKSTGGPIIMTTVVKGSNTTSKTTKVVHGNSKLSEKTQHGYEMYNKKTDEILEYGISGQKLNKNGTSPRIPQKLNTKYNNDSNVGGRVVETDIPNRQWGLDWEKGQVQQHKLNNNGIAPKNQIRPK